MQSNTYIQNRHHNVGIAGGFPDLRYNSRFNPVVYSGTISLRISSVDGTAFLDACAALVPYADGNHLVEIYDASGRMLRGYLGAAGDGEGLGSELLGTWVNSGANPFETFDGSAPPNIASAINTTGYAVADSTLSSALTLGMLLKSANNITLNSGAAPKLNIHSGSGSIWNVNELQLVSGPNETYCTQRATIAGGTALLRLYHDSGVVGDWSSANSYKQVTGPSADGCTIVSAKGGAVQSFSYKGTFTYNEASYQVIVRVAR